ncbi:MAG: hypothetical protein CL666_02995 [Balneola sp.]|nr:hypothetical protein [Balneola sp.]
MVSFVSVFPPYRGGIATFSDYLYRNLKDITQVEAFNFSHLYPSLLFPGKTQFDTTKMDSDYAQRVLHAWNPFNWKKAAEQILSPNPDQVIFSYWHPFFAPAFLKVIGHIQEKASATSIHILAHNVMPHENFPFGETLSGKLLNKADSVILLSQKSLEEASALDLNINISVLFHPVYEQSFPSDSKQELRKKYGFSQEDFIPLFFGLIRPYKGLDLFIEALNTLDLNMNNIKPLIAGEFYTEKEPLISNIREDHKEDYTIIDRFVSDHEMAELFTLSDILVMPYRSATQSGILANAINFHLPSIVTDLKGLTEHVEHKKNSWIISQNNTSELAEAIISLKNSALRSALKEALIPLKEELSWHSFSQQLLSEISKEKP